MMDWMVMGMVMAVGNNQPLDQLEARVILALVIMVVMMAMVTMVMMVQW